MRWKKIFLLFTNEMYKRVYLYIYYLIGPSCSFDTILLLVGLELCKRKTNTHSTVFNGKSS